MIPGVLQLSDCIDRCHRNQSCKSLNFETGLCVLLTTAAADKATVLTASQFPVFTIFAQKICISGKPCRQCGTVQLGKLTLVPLFVFLPQTFSTSAPEAGPLSECSVSS